MKEKIERWLELSRQVITADRSTSIDNRLIATGFGKQSHEHATGDDLSRYQF
jgi:hypothetical protein